MLVPCHVLIGAYRLDPKGPDIKTIPVVEDDEPLAYSLAKQLEVAGYTVRSVSLGLRSSGSADLAARGHPVQERAQQKPMAPATSRPRTGSART